MIISGVFLRRAEQSPEATMVHHLGVDHSYQDVARRAENVATGLRELGLKPGDRVGMLIENGVEYVISYFAVQLAGGIVVSLNPATTSRELDHTLVHSEPAFVIYSLKSLKALAAVIPRLTNLVALIPIKGSRACEGIFHVQFDELAERKSPSRIQLNHSERVAQIVYTSGTTGHPKGVALTHGNLSANTRSITESLDLVQADSVFVVLPFYYSYGNSLLLTHAFVGGRLVMATDFIFWNRALELMNQQRATGFCGVPSTFSMLLHRSSFGSTDFPSLRYTACAGGALAPAVVERLQHCLPTAKLYLMYGQTEATARLSILRPKDLPKKIGSVGKGLPGVSLKVLDEKGCPASPGEIGELYAQGDNVMQGYWNDHAETRNVLTDYGLRTGDLARTDSEGYIYVVGRRTDMIKTGANRVNPLEVEEVIFELSGIAEVAVIGEPDALLGESIVAYVVTAGNVVDGQAIMDHSRVQLPTHKRPRRIEFVQELPKTANGKIRRAAIG